MATQSVSGTSGVAETKEAVQVSEMERVLGAAFISSGIGSAVLGILIVLTTMKAGAGLKTALTWVTPAGPLSGKTGVAVIAFILSWVILHFVFKNRPIKLTTSFAITIALVVLGLLTSYPPIFELFAK